MFDEFQQAATSDLRGRAARAADCIRNPDSDRLKALALEEPEVEKTKYGSIYADSEPMSRAAKFTRNNIDSRFGRRRAASCWSRPSRRWPRRRSSRSTWRWATAARASPPG